MMIVHRLENQRFELEKDGIIAYLSYCQVSSNQLDYQHVIVPDKLAGQGIGSQLVHFALEYALQQNMKIIASCPFVEHYIKKHQHYTSLLVK